MLRRTIKTVAVLSAVVIVIPSAVYAFLVIGSRKAVEYYYGP